MKEGTFPRFATVGDKTLHKISGSVDVEVDGDRFQVRSNSDRAESARIDAVGEILPAASSIYPIYRGRPKFLVHNGVLKRHGDRKSLRMRSAGRREDWRPFLAEALPLGLVEVAAFEGGAILDRLTFLHVPKVRKRRGFGAGARDLQDRSDRTVCD